MTFNSILSTLILLIAAGCAPDATDAPVQRAASSITWGDTIDMEEGDSALLALPAVTRDGDGFLVAELMEVQVRHYDGSGRLDWSAGRKGEGPGELHRPTSVARLPSGDVVATDFQSRLIRYSADGTQVLKTTTLPLSRVERVIPLSDERVILAAVGDSGLLVHVWNLDRDSVERSFFRGSDHVTNKGFARSADYVILARRADTLAIGYSISDSIFYYTIAGERIGAMRMPADSFRLVEPTIPLDDRINSDTAFRGRWLRSLDVVSKLAWLGDGTLLVQYRPPNLHGPDDTAMLLHMTRDGQKLMEVRTPALLSHDATTDSLYFIAPDAEAPNRWVSARINE